MQQKHLEDFSVGQYYRNLEELERAIESYNHIRDTDFTIVASNKKSVLVKCKHGRHEPSQHSNSKSTENASNIGCAAYIILYRSPKCGDATVTVTKTNLLHNHMVQKDPGNLPKMNFEGKDKEMFLKLRQANAQLSLINSVLIDQKNKKNIITLTENQTKELLTHKQSNSKNYDQISLDALEEFLAHLMDKSDGESGGKRNLTDKDKYKIVMPVLNRIGRLITRQPTRQFLGYLEDLSKLETSIHVGYRDTPRTRCSENHVAAQVENNKPSDTAEPTEDIGGGKLSRSTSNASDIHVTMTRKSDVEIHHRRDMQAKDIDINNFQSSDFSTIELNLRIPSFFSM